MNNEHLKASTSWDTVQTLHSKLNRLEARLAEVEKESKVWESRANGLDVDLAMLGNELFKVKEAVQQAIVYYETPSPGNTFRLMCLNHAKETLKETRATEEKK